LEGKTFPFSLISLSFFSFTVILLSKEINRLGCFPLEPEFILEREENEEKNPSGFTSKGSHRGHTNNEAPHVCIGVYDFLENSPAVALEPKPFTCMR
jgi:hypothetical protein